MNKIISMEKIAFKTNIMCSACVAKVAPELNKTAGENNWEIDITNPQKILTVTAEDTAKQAIKNAVERAGYKAQSIN